MNAWIIPFVVLCFVGGLSVAGEDKPPQFSSLAEAVQALDGALAAPNPGAALLALLPAGTTYLSEHPEVAAMLCKERERTGPFSKLYAKRQFPEAATTFKLGGHQSELGHIHIDFIREGAAWKLKDIWNCR